METILTILTTGFLCLLSFYMGSKTNSTEPIKLPTINPIKKIKEYHENKEEELERKIFDTNLENINNYDGTPAGQKDIPR